MNELQLSNNLPVIESEIKAYQNLAGEAIFEIGRRLKHVKENDLVHGEFGKWLESVNLTKSQADRFIKIHSEHSQGKLPDVGNIGMSIVYEISTLPEPERTKEHVTSKGETKTPDEMTVRELRELKKQLKEEKERNESLSKQAELANRKIEELEDAEPEVIERYMEPDDYQSIKNMNEHLESEREYYKKQADDFRNEVRNIMNQPNKSTEFTEEDNQEDYTPVLIQLLKPVEEFINYYGHHINNEKALNEIEKIKNILKEQ